MPASYPKPDDQKVTRHKPRFDWTVLPAEHDLEAPTLPDWRMWHPRTLEWWSELWSKPQATQWDESGSTLHVLATLVDDLIADRVEPHRVSGEIRQIEDRHGLTPKAMLQLRWQIDDSELAGDAAGPVDAGSRSAASTPTGTSSKLRDRLRVVASDGAPTFPRSRGAGWFELSDGTKVRGEPRARAAQADIDR